MFFVNFADPWQLVKIFNIWAIRIVNDDVIHPERKSLNGFESIFSCSVCWFIPKQSGQIANRIFVFPSCNRIYGVTFGQGFTRKCRNMRSHQNDETIR